MNDRPGEATNRDRRRHDRAPLQAQAVVHVGAIAVRGQVVDLSLGGVRIQRADETSPCPAIGSIAMVELGLGGRAWVTVHGRVARGELDEVVVRFGPLDAEVEDQIEDEVNAALDVAPRPRMMVVDPSAVRRHRVAETLRAAGCDPYEAATPLEAIELLERHHRIRGVTVAEHLTQTKSDEFCDFVAETNPGIKLALIADALADDEDSIEASLRGLVDSVGSGPLAAPAATVEPSSGGRRL